MSEIISISIIVGAVLLTVTSLVLIPEYLEYRLQKQCMEKRGKFIEEVNQEIRHKEQKWKEEK